MPRNGTGGYSLPNNSWNPAVNGTAATAADWQTLINDVAAAVQQSVSSDGQTPMTGSLKMSGFVVTGLGAPSGVGQSLRWEQLTKGADVASSATLTFPVEGSYFVVTGTTTVTSITDVYPGRVFYVKFAAALTLTNSASLVLPQGANITTAANDMAIFLNDSPGVWICVSYHRANTAQLSVYGSNPALTVNIGPIYVNGIGFMTFYNGAYAPNNLSAGYRGNPAMTSTTTAVTVNPVSVRSADNLIDIILGSALTKTIQTSGAWAAGNNQNGLFAGAKANSTWYDVFLIRNDTTGVVDVGFDTNLTALNRPAGYTGYQLLGSVFVDSGGNIKSFVQVDPRTFYWVARTQDVIGGAANTGAGTAITLTVPIRRRVMASLGVLLDASNPGASVAISPVDAVPSAVGTSGALGDVYRDSSPTQQFNTFNVLTSTTGQIIAKGSVVISTAVEIGTRGWAEIF